MFYLFNPDKWRYERKFVITSHTTSEVESIVRLHPAMFSEIYHERIVNNIYFDSFAMTNYLHNVVGNSQRVKVRIRWYGNTLGTIKHPVLEIKLKSGQLGSKISFPLEPFNLDTMLSINHIHSLLSGSQDIPDVLKTHLTCLDFSLLNSYTRRYYLSADNVFRITIDSDMKFYSITPCYNTFLFESTDHYNTILELKYERQHDSQANKITNSFPFRVTKSSKYITGVDRLNLL